MSQTVSLLTGTRFRIGGRFVRLAGTGSFQFDDANSLDDVAEILGASDESLSNQSAQTRNLEINAAALNRQIIAGADYRDYPGLVFPSGGVSVFTTGDGLDITYSGRGKKIYTDRGQPPAFGAASVENAAPTILVVNFDQDVNSLANNYLLGFTCLVGGVNRVINSAARQADNKIIWLTLASAVVNGNVVTFSFDQTLSDLKSDNGAAVQSTTNHAVTNNVA